MDSHVDSSAVHANKSEPLVSLQNYVANVFYGVFIQDDNEIALEVYRKNWSRDVKEVENGTPLNFEQFQEALIKTRASFDNRSLVSQSAIVAPADPEGKAGQVAHTSNFAATSNGQQIRGTIVSVLKIDFVNGKRQIETETFVLSTGNT